MNPDALKRMMENGGPTMYGQPAGRGNRPAMPALNIDSMSNVAVQVDNAIAKTKDYIDAHLTVARALNKPMVISEFGYPRDHHRYDLDDTTAGRDAYYGYVFERLVDSYDAKDNLAGCNFWAWGGTGRASHLFWQPWDDYLGDPSQEEQGLNAVFDTDTTLGVIKSFEAQLHE
jgi:mannan endo-1,4-beta-mannosidase